MTFFYVYIRLKIKIDFRITKVGHNLSRTKFFTLS